MFVGQQRYYFISKAQSLQGEGRPVLYQEERYLYALKEGIHDFG